MHTITLSDNEQTLLLELVDAQLKELPHEIHHTDDPDYRQLLQNNADALEKLRKQIQSS